MQWLNQIVDAIITRFPENEVLVESGASPSGSYHIGHLREVITCDAIVLELRRRGREARHIHFVDDLDGLRKIPVNVSDTYEEYLGRPLCDIPAPGAFEGSFSDYFLDGFLKSMNALGIEVEVLYSHEKYRSGFFTPAIERALDHIDQARHALETISQRQLDTHWSPIQILEKGRLKSRPFVSIDKATKTIQYKDANDATQTVRYDAGEVKMDWRLDWPGRWWLLGIHVEPFGRDHATKGGSFDTGVEIMHQIYEAEPPIPVPYDFINRVGDNKKMSASKGTGIEAAEVMKILPAEIVRYFMLQHPPAKRLYFDQVAGVIKLVDEFAELTAKTHKTPEEEQLIYLCTRGLDHKTVSRVPFSHLVTSYQAALKDVPKTLVIIRRTEYADSVDKEAEIIKTELQFIDQWLTHWAPEDVKFELLDEVRPDVFSDTEKTFLRALGEKIACAPADADGAWFHSAIYELKDTSGLTPKEMFGALYRTLIGKSSGPRIGWFLSILPHDWLVKRLSFES